MELGRGWIGLKLSPLGVGVLGALPSLTCVCVFLQKQKKKRFGDDDEDDNNNDQASTFAVKKNRKAGR